MSLATKLRYVGFCGIDDSVSAELLILISQRYSFVEWGVLFRSDLEGTPRYASTTFLNRLNALRKEYNSSIHLAGHFCNDRCREILAGDYNFATKIHKEWGFNRIQINATAANGVNTDPSLFPTYAQNILISAAALPSVEWIIQLNTETQAIWNLLIANTIPSNISVLFDASCGKGIAIQDLPAPDTYHNIPCGYAGGIGPRNITTILQAVDRVVTVENAVKPVWIDMESSLRTIVIKDTTSNSTDDIFDLNKCMACIDMAIQLGVK